MTNLLPRPKRKAGENVERAIRKLYATQIANGQTVFTFYGIDWEIGAGGDLNK